MLLKLFISFIFIYLNIFAIRFSTEEINWIKKNYDRTFNIYVYNPKHIYLYENEDGNLRGVYINFFENITNQTGLNFNFKSLEKSEMQDILNNGKGDVIFNASKSKEREKHYSFLPTLNSYTLGLYSKSDTIIDFQNLDKYKVGLIPTTSDFILLDKFYPDLKNKAISINDKENFGFWALESGLVDAVVGKSSNDILKNYRFTPFENIPSTHLWMAINKEEPILESIISKFKVEFTTKYVANILKNERPIFYKQLLSKELIIKRVQRRYSSLKVFIPEAKGMLPLFYKTKSGYKGYVIDRLEELSKLTELPIVYTQNPNDDYDIKAIDSKLFENNSNAYFIPYYKVQVAAFSNRNQNFLDTYQSAENKKVGIISFEKINPYFLNFLPNFKFYKIYPDTDSALDAILKNEIDYVYADFKIMSMAIGNRYLDDKVQVAGFLGNSPKIGFGIKKDPDLAKLVDKIFPNHLAEIQILQTELTVPKRLSPNYQYLLFVFSSMSLLIATLFYLLRKATIASKKEKRITKALVESFEAANELNDEDTGNHILRVNLYSKFLAEKLKCSNKFIKEIGEYASLHDVGKIAISDMILKKPAKLTEEEFNEMKKHVIFGKELVQKMQLGPIAENIALYHHEKWNGKGYWFGLSADAIPLEARIVALADVYDALRQKRVYKDGFTHDVAVEIIKKERGEHFDPALVDIFLIHHKEFDKIFISH